MNKETDQIILCLQEIAETLSAIKDRIKEFDDRLNALEAPKKLAEKQATCEHEFKARQPPVDTVDTGKSRFSYLFNAPSCVKCGKIELPKMETNHQIYFTDSAVLCEHQYPPGPWMSVTPPHCLKCGTPAQSFTVT